jgi:Tfp pilus assembly protein PilF
VFWQVSRFDFVSYDDAAYVSENRDVQQGLTQEGIAWAFTTRHAGNWHPVTWMSHMLDCQLFGLNANAHHSINLLAHVANVLLLFNLLRRTTGAIWQSGLVAVLFAVHPLHVESVAWIAERKDVLSTFFWLLTVWVYALYTGRRQFGIYILSLAVFWVGLMTKPMLVTLPVILLLLDYWPIGRFVKKTSWQSLALEKVPFLLLSGISAIVTFVAQKDGGAVASVEQIPINLRIENAVVSYAAYLFKTIRPMDLAVFYPFDPQLPTWKVASSALALAAISILVIACARRRPYLATGWLWYLVMLLPVIGLVQVGAQSMADRYSYLSLVGIFIMLTWGISEAADYTNARTGRVLFSMVLRYSAAGLLILALAARSWFQVGYWRNTTTLFEHAWQVTKNNYIAFIHLGIVASEEGRFDEALDYYRKTLNICPNYPLVYSEIGTTLLRQGRIDAAIRAFRHSLNMKPDNPRVYNNLGIALAKQNKLEEAVEYFIKALSIRPDDDQAHQNFIRALTKMDDETKMIAKYREALKISPDWIVEMVRLSWLLATRPESNPEDQAEALRMAEKARDLDRGKDPVLLQTLAAAYARNRRYEDAVKAATEAVESAEDLGEPKLANQIREQRKLYRARQPFLQDGRMR